MRLGSSRIMRPAMLPSARICSGSQVDFPAPGGRVEQNLRRMLQGG
ncbi:hypothetical protein LNQ03_11770 [Klebsiella pneumoniae subsp. pneumoniae]|nr:hypothetical protein [Klebsiella pneumoniae subsp. pneumoniae]